MKIAILSCFYPFRGGIAQFNANLFEELGKEHDVCAFNFTRQYPGLLFPGKTQYVTEQDTAVPVEAQALLDTADPFSWGRTARAVRRWDPDLLILRYWMSWFSPSLGHVAAHMEPNCKVIGILDNVIPHERHWFDTPLTRLFLRTLDGAVTLCEEVGRDLKALRISKVPGEGYVIPARKGSLPTDLSSGVLRIQFSGNLAVVKTRPGLANAVASLIDQQIIHPVIGTIAGDDTILLILRADSTLKQVLDALSPIFPDIQSRLAL